MYTFGSMCVWIPESDRSLPTAQLSEPGIVYNETPLGKFQLASPVYVIP